ncbi:hypothetical protein LCGC14_0580780 [marine sediment metagenome]|uniref:Uncharacterized protein n=1 Tax=marine sediment metagenome TaxID=412755 RepID=A0A0F9U2P5_9ZZZZ
MEITDENRKDVAKYLADYVVEEVDRSLKIEGFGPWDTGNMEHWIEQGLNAYESINQPSQYAISRSIEGISLNGQEFLLSDNKDVRLFDSIAEAKEHAHSVGITDEDFDNVTCNICEYLPETGDYVIV